MQLIEGGHYLDTAGENFRVVAVGKIYGKDVFVIKINNELCVFQLPAWRIIFPSPQLKKIDSIVSTSDLTGLHHGFVCSCIKHDNGELEISTVTEELTCLHSPSKTVH